MRVLTFALFAFLLCALLISSSALRVHHLQHARHATVLQSDIDIDSDTDTDVDVDVDMNVAINVDSTSVIQHELEVDTDTAADTETETEVHQQAAAAAEETAIDAASIQTTVTTAAPILPYSDAASKYLFNIATSAYCSIPAIQKWTCSFCMGVKGFTVETVISNDAKSMSAVIGRSPAMDNVFGRPVIVVAFKGTDPKSLPSVLNDIKIKPVNVAYCSGCTAHQGFYDAYMALKKDLEPALQRLITLMVPGAPVIVTGYSLGAAVASVAAGSFLANGLGAKNPIMVWNFGSPRVGNPALAAWITAKTGGNYYRVTHDADLIVQLPPKLLLGYAHAGTEIWYNKDWSRFVTCALGEDPKCSTGQIASLDITIHLTYFNVAFVKMVDDLTCRNSNGNAGALVAQPLAYDHNIAAYLMKFCGVTYCNQALIKAWSCNYCQDAQLKSFKITNQFYDANTMQFAYAGVEMGSNNPTKGPFILASFKGTTATALRSWYQDLKLNPVDPGYKACSNCRVHQGFLGCYNAIGKQIAAEVKRLQALYPTYPVILVGQSLGAAVVHIAAVDFIANQGIKPKMVYNFGSPRVGNLEFDRYFTNAITAAKTTFYRVVNWADPVVHVPPTAMGFVHSSPEIFYSKDGRFSLCLSDEPRCAGQILPPLYNWFDHLHYVGDQQDVFVQDKRCNP